MREIEYLISAIEMLRAEGRRVIVAIDGPCGAGKTTLAASLAERLSAEVIHTDDFFLRKSQRTAQRLAQVGGNIDYERFLEEVALPISRGDSFSYRRYDCREHTLVRGGEVKGDGVVIVEGCYSMHPTLYDIYDLRVFLGISPELQRERILRRPSELHVRFFEEWIPMERRYFSELHIEDRSDIIIQNIAL